VTPLGPPALSAIATIVHLTLFEARRRKILAAGVMGGGAFLVVFGVGVFFGVRELAASGEPFVARQAILTLLTLAGLYAANFLAVLLAVLLPVDALSGEIDSGVMQTLASKPVRRSEIVVGKWLGYSIIAIGYLGLLFFGVLAIVWMAAGHVPVHPARGLGLMLLEVTLLVTVTIAGGTRLGTVANGIFALGYFGLGFVSGLVEQVGALAGIQSAKNIGIAVSLLSPTDALWRMAAYHLQPPIVRDVIDGPPMLAVISVPNALMAAWTAALLVVTLAWAIRSFARRTL
jgi:ABC-type transport system involved in multi-copper enzyme maturation permease subunit